MKFVAIIVFSFVIVGASKVSLEGKSNGLPHYGTDLNKLMQGMKEIERSRGQRVFFKTEQTKTGSLETRVIIPDTEAGLQQVGGSQFIEGPEMREHQSLAPQMMPEEEMVLPDKQFVQ